MRRLHSALLVQARFTGPLCLWIVMAGCSERLARENVFANTETMLGITLTENPTTQLYEARLGYARHELFYVPTGKLVYYRVDPATGKLVEVPACCGSNDPSNTPEVLAEIQVNGRDPKQSQTFGLRQKLAVGKEAVKSGAATALMADSPQEALAASGIAAFGTSASQRVQAWLHQDLEANPLKLRQWLNDHDRGGMKTTKWLAEAPDAEIKQAIKDLGIE